MLVCTGFRITDDPAGSHLVRGQCPCVRGSPGSRSRSRGKAIGRLAGHTPHRQAGTSTKKGQQPGHPGPPMPESSVRRPPSSQLADESLDPAALLPQGSLTVRLARVLNHVYFLFCDPPVTSACFSVGLVVFLAFISESSLCILEKNTSLCREVPLFSPGLALCAFPSVFCFGLVFCMEVAVAHICRFLKLWAIFKVPIESVTILLLFLGSLAERIMGS